MYRFGPSHDDDEIQSLEFAQQETSDQQDVAQTRAQTDKLSQSELEDVLELELLDPEEDLEPKDLSDEQATMRTPSSFMAGVDPFAPPVNEPEEPQEPERPKKWERAQTASSLVSAPEPATAPFPTAEQGVAVTAPMGLFPSLISAFGNRQKQQQPTPPPPDPDTLNSRLQKAREARALDHMILLEECINQCEQGLREVCDSPLWQQNKADIETGKKDAKDFFLELAHKRSQDHLDLNSKIRNMAADLQSFERQIHHVKNACETAKIDPSEALYKAESFLDKFQDDPASKLIPDPSDGIAIHDKLKELLQHVRKLMQGLFGQQEEAELGMQP